MIYHGFRPKDSFEMHRAYANEEDDSSYEFIFPKGMGKGSYGVYESVFEDMMENLNNEEETREFEGMNPDLGPDELVFDSHFESGNLDLVVKVHLHVQFGRLQRTHTTYS